jgi:predicted GNAT family N-acyltransferase
VDTIVNASRAGATVEARRRGLLARVAVTTEDQLVAYRLRYDVYIAEQGKPYPESDHHNKCLLDELDAESDVVVVESADRIIGTVRGTWLESPAAIARYAHVFEVARFSAFQLTEIGVCSRLAVSMDHRNAQTLKLLLSTLYARALDCETRLCFATCAPMFLRMFRRYGFREYAAPIRDPIVGTLHRICLVLDDVEHLTTLGSPFAPVARRHGITSVSRPWLDALLADRPPCHG